MSTAGAALLPAVNGQVYDDVLEISWLQDANFVKTSCDANNALWQAFDPPPVIDGGSGRSKAQICTDNGRLNWNEAEGWIAVLNANNHLGHSDWRQWQVPDPTNDPSCSVQDFDGVDSDRGFGCTGSEMGNLFNVTLGNPNNEDDSCAPDCLENTGPFSNFQSFWYWSGTEYAPSPSLAWGFSTNLGRQDEFGNIIDVVGYVWPVRPGQDVGVDVRPWAAPNWIVLFGLPRTVPYAVGVLPVAILSSASLDAVAINPATVEIGDPLLAGVLSRQLWRHWYQDVNGDGRDDLVLFFGLNAMVAAGALGYDTEELRLTAETWDGVAVEGSDAVRVLRVGGWFAGW